MSEREELAIDWETTRIPRFGRLPDRSHLLIVGNIQTGNVTCYSKWHAPIAEGIARCQEAGLLIAHNGVGFDFPFMTEVEGYVEQPHTLHMDTLILSRLFYSDLTDTDMPRLISKANRQLDDDDPMKFKGSHKGSHGLEAWGLRLGYPKGDYAKVMEARGLDPWAELNEKMVEYGIDDVHILIKLWLEKIKPHMQPRGKYTPKAAINIEHEVAEHMARLKRHGIRFNVEKAEALAADLEVRQKHLYDHLQEKFPPRIEPRKWVYEPDKDYQPSILAQMHDNKPIYHKQFGYRPGEPRGMYGEAKIPKRSMLKIKGQPSPTQITEGCPYTPAAIKEFNPNSRIQICRRLMEMGWQPTEFTNTGNPSTDEVELTKLEETLPEARDLVKYLLITKRLGQLKTGDKAWLSSVDPEGFVHPTINSCATVTFRATHSDFNVSQVPGVKHVKALDDDGNPIFRDDGEPKMVIGKGEDGKWGWDCRECFEVPDGFRQVGTDLSGIELRLWAHRMYPFDRGNLIKVVLEGDIHEQNRVALGFNDRRDAKAFLYALMYGAGDEKLGFIINPTASLLEQRRIGGEARARFMQSLFGMEGMTKWLHKEVHTLKALQGLDGRRVPVRKAFAALNSLLQSDGAIVSKYWISEIMYQTEYERKWKYGYDGDFAMLLYSHDELQFAVRPHLVDELKTICTESALIAGQRLKLHIPIEAEAVDGPNWAHTH